LYYLFSNFVGHPNFTMTVITACSSVCAKQPRASDASTKNMVKGRLIKRNNGPAGTSHTGLQVY
ncbi:hypothetical protein, partial [Marinagarivorans algicola]|uniref:hypothetical protein n=1 Tax=Marinagarivorans algicola TaxID=1513270 RepID=UPI001C0FF7DE